MSLLLERLSMLQGMRDEMVLQATMTDIDCDTQAFRELDSAIRCLDDHHISRLRVSLDIGREIPLGDWLARSRSARKSAEAR